MKSLFLTVLLLALSGCTEKACESLPPETDISKMMISWRNPSSSVSDEEEFTISSQDYGKILSLLNNRKYDRFPAKWQVLGQVEIETKSSPKTKIGLFRTFERDGAFSINRTYYRGSNDEIIIAVLNYCSKAAKNQKEQMPENLPKGAGSKLSP